ncbi:MAG: carotenoid oxygenase family protein [Ktedonobacteraceae bacterium]
MANAKNLNYTSLDEEIAVDRLPIQGKMPGWLSGSLLRNGPAKFEVGSDKFRHWFDGFAMLHRFTFHGDVVSYANKFLQSDMYKISLQEGRIAYSQFATDPCKAAFKGEMTESVNANVTINKVAGEYVAMTETPLPMAFDPDTLETLGVVHYDDDLTGHHGSAHPHYDFSRRMSISYMTEFNMPSVFRVYGIRDNEHRRVLIGSYTVVEPCYLHSFGMTENYVIIAEYPYRVNPLNLLMSGKPFIENYEWRPQEPAKFIVMRKEDGKIIGSYETAAFFSFHHINAFERSGQIIVDISAYSTPTVVNQLYLDQLRGETTNQLQGETTAPTAAAEGEMRRYSIPLTGSTVHHEVLAEATIELPTINYRRYNAHDYNVAYGVSTDKRKPEAFANRLIRVEVNGRKGQNTRFWVQENCYPGEPVFAEAPTARNEDDGVILSVVLDANKGNSFLLVLDAHTFEEIARAEVPHHIPQGFHGEFFPAIV